MASSEDLGKAKAMTSLHRKVLTKVHSLVMETMVFSDVLRSHLITDEVLELDEARDVREKSGHNAQNSCVLELLQRKPDYAYYSFLDALEKGNQKHVADIIKEKEAELEEEETLRISQMSNLQSSSSKASEACCHESYQTSVMRYGSGAEIVCLNSNNVVALPGKQEQQQEEQLNLVCRRKHPMLPALPQQLTEEERMFQQRREQTKAGKTNRAQQSPLAGEGCMIGVKLFIREVCTTDDKWFVPEDSLQKAINTYIWTTLSQVLTKTLPEENSPEPDFEEKSLILEFLLNLRDYCKVKHVGLEPVQLVVQCTTADSLDRLLKVDFEGTLATELGYAVCTETLARQLNIKNILLQTGISKLEVKLAKRILNKRVATMDVKMQSTPERYLPLEHAWLKKVQTDLLQNGTAIHTAVEAFVGKVTKVQESSVLFTLQFYSLKDLKTFREKLVSGQLVHLFEKALITDEVKQNYGLDTLGLSLTMVDPWEYDMCEMELESAAFDIGDEIISEDESTKDRSFVGENSQHGYCCEHVQTIEHLRMTIKELREKYDALQQAQVKREQIEKEDMPLLSARPTSDYAGSAVDSGTQDQELPGEACMLIHHDIYRDVPDRACCGPLRHEEIPELDFVSRFLEDSSSTGFSKQETGLHLRAYQEELARPAMEGKNVIVSAPTGSGKTYVAIRIIQHHFESADLEEDPKVVFIVPTQALVNQQWEMFKMYLSEYESTGISGDMDLEIPIEQLFQRYQIIILTPQILVDALKKETVSSLSVFSLLMYDECHHTMKTHPYARIQYYYLDSKLRGRPTNLPQIVGLTASVGVGKITRTAEQAVNHILRLCANLDAEELGTVETHQRELAKFVNKPNNDKYQVRGRQNDPFFVCVSNMMKLIEAKMKRAEELKKVNDDQVVKQLTSPPSDRGSERYIEWLGKLRRPVACIPDQNVRRLYCSCTTHLDMYNSALLLNADCRTIDALDFIARTIGTLDPTQADDTDKWLHRIFNDEEDYLQEISEDPENTNPKLEVVKEVILKGAWKNPDLRCIVFVKTREMTVALAKWMNDDDQLKHLGANRLAGKGPSAIKAGMNQAQQEDVLEYFKNGEYKVILATTVAEEGLDIQKCNLVIRYEHTPNEIASVQARGRGRAEGAEYVVVGGTGTGTVEREEINLMREKTMEQAIKKIRAMDAKTFHGRVWENQKEILMEWKRLERGSGRNKPRKDQEENIYELRCKKCDIFTCHSTDIRKIQDSHHVVMDLQVLHSVKIKAYPRPAKFNDFDSLGKLFCKNCGKDWGIQGLYKDNKFQIIAIKSFVVVSSDQSRDTFRQWKEVPFEVPTLNADEFQIYKKELEMETYSATPLLRSPMGLT